MELASRSASCRATNADVKERSTTGRVASDLAPDSTVGKFKTFHTSASKFESIVAIASILTNDDPLVATQFDSFFF